MAIRTVVTGGFGNGTFAGTIPLVVTRGYAIQVSSPVLNTWTVMSRSGAWTVNAAKKAGLTWTVKDKPR